MALSIILCIGIFLASTILNSITKDKGSAKSIQYDHNDVVKYLKKKYGSNSNEPWSDISVYKGKETKINTPNYSQDRLNNYYNNHYARNYSEKVNGTCWAVSTMQLLRNYNAKKKPEDIFVDVINTTKSRKIEGPNFSNSDILVNYMFSKYNMKYEADNDRYDIYKELKNEINNKRSLIFKMSDHRVTAAGYVTYTIYGYRNTPWGKRHYSEQENFVIINDGWSDIRQYSYFPESEIGTTIFSRWNFGITKVEKK